MSGENDLDKPIVPGGIPSTPIHHRADESPIADANRDGPSDENYRLKHTPPSEAEPVKVGARDVQPPTSPVDGSDLEGADEEPLHERLARKDRTPADDGGSSSLS